MNSINELNDYNDNPNDEQEDTGLRAFEGNEGIGTIKTILNIAAVAGLAATLYFNMQANDLKPLEKNMTDNGDLMVNLLTNFTDYDYSDSLMFPNTAYIMGTVDQLAFDIQTAEQMGLISRKQMLQIIPSSQGVTDEVMGALDNPYNDNDVPGSLDLTNEEIDLSLRQILGDYLEIREDVRNELTQNQTGATSATIFFLLSAFASLGIMANTEVHKRREKRQRAEKRKNDEKLKREGDEVKQETNDNFQDIDRPLTPEEVEMFKNMDRPLTPDEIRVLLNAESANRLKLEG